MKRFLVKNIFFFLVTHIFISLELLLLSKFQHLRKLTFLHLLWPFAFSNLCLMHLLLLIPHIAITILIIIIITVIITSDMDFNFSVTAIIIVNHIIILFTFRSMFSNFTEIYHFKITLFRCLSTQRCVVSWIIIVSLFLKTKDFWLLLLLLCFTRILPWSIWATYNTHSLAKTSLAKLFSFAKFELQCLLIIMFSRSKVRFILNSEIIV